MSINRAQKMLSPGGPRGKYARKAYLLAAQRRASVSVSKPFERPVLLQVTVFKGPRAARN
jgi:hypothetical protein